MKSTQPQVKNRGLNFGSMTQSFRSAGSKPYDFHRLRYSSTSKDFHKSTHHQLQKPFIQIIQTQIAQKKPELSHNKRKLQRPIDRWKERYGKDGQISYIRHKVQEGLPILHKYQSKTNFHLMKKLNQVGTPVSHKHKKGGKRPKKPMSNIESKNEVIMGNSLNMECKSLLDAKKQKFLIKITKHSQSHREISKKSMEPIPQRWQFTQDYENLNI